MRIFISSVRKGLEEERDALPGLIRALGHTPVLFEDFTAQTTPAGKRAWQLSTLPMSASSCSDRPTVTSSPRQDSRQPTTSG